MRGARKERSVTLGGGREWNRARRTKERERRARKRKKKENNRRRTGRRRKKNNICTEQRRERVQPYHGLIEESLKL